MAKEVTNFERVQLKLKPEEQARWEALYRNAQSRTDAAVETSGLVRILLGLDMPNSLCTQDDIDIFRGRKEDQKVVVTSGGKSAKKKPTIEEIEGGSTKIIKANAA